MLQAQFESLSGPQLKFFSKYLRSTLRLWDFSSDQIDAIKWYGNIGMTEALPPLWFLGTNAYINSGISISSNPPITPTPSPYNPMTPIDIAALFDDEPEYEDGGNEDGGNEDGDEEDVYGSSPQPLDANRETSHDLQVKYLHTYGLLEGKPVYITDIVSSSASLKGYKIYTHTLGEDGSFIASGISQDINDFNMVIPKLGYINHSNLTIYLERKHKKNSPSRYRRGLRADTLIITNPSAAEYKEAYSSSDPYSTYDYGEEKVLQKILYSLFFPVHYPYPQALASLLEFKRLSCAISATFSLSLDFKTNKIVLYRNQFAIGHYNQKALGIILTTDLFKDEVIASGVIVK